MMACSSGYISPAGEKPAQPVDSPELEFARAGRKCSVPGNWGF